jgi:hypothetical protein
MTPPVSTPEARPDLPDNALTRDLDWRFLLRRSEAPRAVDLTSGRRSRALSLVCETVQEGGGRADLVVLGYPTRAALRRARETLRPGGEVVCLWGWPMPGGVGHARRRIERAGFLDARVYWPGPVPHRPPQFWLPLGSQAAAAHLLADRPPTSIFQAALRPIWRAARRVGGLMPLCAIATAPNGQGDQGDAIDAGLGGEPSWMLLTGGKSIVNKVVGLPFEGTRSTPPAVVKFARVPHSEEALAREADVLRRLEEERPDVEGVPRVKSRFRRAGRLAVAESAVFGRSLVPELTPENFADHARRITRWLVELAGDGPPQPASQWWPRLVEEPLGQLERMSGVPLGPGSIDRARQLLKGLDALPLVFEHRDCAPWNIVLTDGDAPAVLDWESAEPRGLPACDLIYFLATATFVLEGSIESGRIRDGYAVMLDSRSAYGRIAAACLEEYSARLGIDRGSLERLRLLCWIERCRRGSPELGPITGIDERISMEAVSVRLVAEELRRAG